MFILTVVILRSCLGNPSLPQGQKNILLYFPMYFPRGSAGKEFACNIGATAKAEGLTPGSGRSCEVGNGNPLQYSCLGLPMDCGTWQTTVHWLTELDMTE